MKAVGLIVEYNPFHNGHKYHLEKAKQESKADIAIAVMSSNFIQRGEPALLDKWARTEMAIQNGVDIVIELPVFYSNQSAEIFSLGAVGILNKLKVDSIVFGSESGEVESLKKVARLQIEKKDELDEIIQKSMSDGESYPNAMAKAIKKVLNIDNIFTPNNILGIEYIKAILKLKSKIKPLTIKREKSDYHSQNIEEEIASATSIRNAIIKGDFESIKKAVPIETYEILEREYQKDNFVFWDDFYEILKYKIITEYDKLKNIQDMEIGFENRIYKAILETTNFNDFFDQIMTKRYTISRVKRILSHILLDIDAVITKEVKQDIAPYVRLLGFNKKGMEYLKQIKKGDEVEFLTNLKGVEKKLSSKKLRMLKFEEKASNIYKIKGKNKDRKIPIIKKGK